MKYKKQVETYVTKDSTMTIISWDAQVSDGCYCLHSKTIYISKDGYRSVDGSHTYKDFNNSKNDYFLYIKPKQI